MPSITGALTNAEYRKVKAYSKSDLDFIHKSTALMEWARNAHSDGSDAIDRGTDLHCALLDPDVFAVTYNRQPDFDLKTAAGRANAESYRDSMAHVDRIILDAKRYDLIIAMRDSVLAHPVAKSLLTVSGKSEQSIFWERDGLKLKCRPDRIPDHEHFGHMLVDLKKVGDMDHLERSIQQYRYHVQSPFYADGYEALTGERPRFVFIAVGERRSIGRHPVRVFELPVGWIDDGRAEYIADLEIAKDFEEFGSTLDIEVLQKPRWLK